MDRRPFVLDTSALFSLLEDEAGADRVESLLRAEKVYLPWVALLEVHYVSYLNAVLVHKDPELAALDGAVDLEALPYKQPDATVG